MRQLESPLFIDHVEEALAAGGLEPSQLTLEVTESTLMRDAEATVARLRRLKEVGVMIAIDDFGTGYSSMAYLRQFPVDVLKIDRTFVAGMDGTPDGDALVRTLVELGRILGLVTLAEGIEEPDPAGRSPGGAVRPGPGLHRLPPGGAGGGRRPLGHDPGRTRPRGDRRPGPA